MMESVEKLFERLLPLHASTQPEPQMLRCRKLPIFAFLSAKIFIISSDLDVVRAGVVVAFIRQLHRSRRGNLRFCGL